MQGPLGAAINQARRLGIPRSDIFGTVRTCRYWSTRYRRATSQVCGRRRGIGVAGNKPTARNLDQTLGTLSRRCPTSGVLAREQLDADRNGGSAANDFAQTLSDQSRTSSKCCVAGPGITAATTSYDPRRHPQRSVVDTQLRNPVQFMRRFIGSPRAVGAGLPPAREICRERLGPSLAHGEYPPTIFHPLNTITAYKGPDHTTTPRPPR